jgi:hypothetical protein
MSKEVIKPRIDIPEDDNKLEANSSNKTFVKEKDQSNDIKINIPNHFDKNETKNNDFYAMLQKENSLGFKSNLDLALRHALKSLETEACSFANAPIEKIRHDFQRYKEHPSDFREIHIEDAFFVYDYRTFLISTMLYYKKRLIRINK